ncbi:hypothetical protein N0V88_004709 [Collariella sp. IMI 366227]|nr:hypothetical protein N0V88_004709 [Collariella sp. IMI 366227]
MSQWTSLWRVDQQGSGTSTITGATTTTASASAITVSVAPAKGTPAQLKQEVLDTVENWCALGPRNQFRVGQEDGDVVLLASSALASWLDDDAFVAQLLQSLGLVPSVSNWRTLNVLAAAVDQVPAYDRRIDSFCSTEGLSIFHTPSGNLLPDAWNAEPAAVADTNPPSLLIQPPLWFSRDPEVTVPLANTLFANGKPHVLSLSKWEFLTSQNAWRRVEKMDKTNQTLVISAEDMGFVPYATSTLASRLAALTKPREIVSGLGNIVRQIKGDSETVPASAELESVIPAYHKWLMARELESSSSENPACPTDGHPEEPSVGPVGVWALICPKGRNYALYSMLKLERLLMNPTTTVEEEIGFAPDEEQDMNNFIRSFDGDTSAGGIVTPGSYIQFLVDMPYARRNTWQQPFPRMWDPVDFSGPTAVFGTPAVTPTVSTATQTTIRPGLFGAISSQGIYLTSTKRGESEDPRPPLETKMDAPRSYFVSSARFAPVPTTPLKTPTLPKPQPEKTRSSGTLVDLFADMVMPNDGQKRLSEEEFLRNPPPNMGRPLRSRLRRDRTGKDLRKQQNAPPGLDDYGL